MKRSELLKQYKIVATRKPLKGDTILAVWNNSGGNCEAIKIDRKFSRVVCDILEKRPE